MHTVSSAASETSTEISLGDATEAAFTNLPSLTSLRIQMEALMDAFHNGNRQKFSHTLQYLYTISTTMKFTDITTPVRRLQIAFQYNYCADHLARLIDELEYNVRNLLRSYPLPPK